ncbi:MAG: amino-acid N-acetyltransferase [Termitinemataceae bacterium]|nr:MAG: amino-acid N-acetyltransferase [Termitinemataceae bacterium]
MDHVSTVEPKLERMDIIREAFLYQGRFEHTTMVFKIDFEVTLDKSFSYLMKDIAALAKMGIRVAIVCGCTAYINSILLEHNIVSQYYGSDRITSDDEMQYVSMAAFNVATRFITALSGSRVDAVIGNFVRARGRGIVCGIDMHNTGSVDKIFSTSLRKALDLGMVPILPCIGWSPIGRPYNVPSNEIAVELASALGAIKLFIVNCGALLQTTHIDVPDEIEQTKDGRIIRLTLSEAQNLVKVQKTKSAERGKKAVEILELAIGASQAGVERVHIINGCDEGSVLRELYSNLGAGTMLYADEYESIRSIRNSDIPDILHIMEPLVEQDILIARTAEDIQKKKDDYVVFVIDSSVHACAALHDWGEGQAEIAALAAEKAYSDMGLGRRLVRFLIEKAGKNGLKRVFVLTTKTHDWFELLGFKEVSVTSLPTAKRNVYNQKRKSKVYALDL